MTGRDTIRLVAEREIVERLRSRVFAVTTALSIAGAVVAVVVGALVGSTSAPTTTVALTPATSALAAPLGDAARRAAVTVHVRTGTEAEVTALVRSGGADVAVVGDVTRPRLVVLHSLDETAGAVILEATRTAAVTRRLVELGDTPDRAAADVMLAPPATTVLDPTEGNHNARVTIAYVGALVLLFAITSTGGAVATAVVSEKAGRIIELLLSTVRAADLLAGKVIGAGLVGLAQVTVVAVAALLAAVALRARLPLDAFGVLPHVVVWFILGYALYGVLYAAAGATVHRFEDMQGAIAPLVIMLLPGFLVAVSALRAPDGTAARVCALLPPTAPVVMPVRAALGHPALWEEPVAAVLTLAAAYGTVLLGGRVFAQSVLRGTRRSWWSSLAAAVRRSDAEVASTAS